ncbi:hypothetical protein HX082_12110 [Myroides odoratimimus]|uniref:hypothetical protein n=1 Tax=Myroides odoratimimus TaxID=76832 RepID=UPI00257493A6|nr:hypothetical protein [Myroides odoratimimus]MDM1494467.1 hypothetical protein [Myroides odoratimimus]MDM1510139.1 hypothetical protein [Myroides odoratimimus]MDM1526786.1 hypothetical protein [Myroides odoratimimus]MDM1680027.1 hypothetical protein [Myroides odoratimimus]MEC4035865.1 hypothetical protein [Myroides odoratimimus]
MELEKYDIYISDICFISSLPKEEQNMINRIIEDFRLKNKYTNYLEKNILTVSELDLNTITDYQNFISQSKDQIITKNKAFIFHIDIHGNTKGLCLKNGDIITWSKFYKDMSDLNKLSGFNQVINFATCYSFQFLEKNINWESASPYQLCIYSKEEVKQQEIEDFYTTFDEEFIRTKDFNSAFSNATNDTKNLRIMSSIDLFEELYNSAVYTIIKEGKIPFYKDLNKHIKNKTTLNHQDILKIPRLRQEKFQYRKKFLGF